MKGEQTPAANSSSFILDDHQIRVSEKTVERYYHHIQRIDTAAGLDDLSQLKFYFEPSYQQLTIHFIRVQRGSTVINRLRPAEIKVIQQEEELDQQLYNGTLAAVVFLNDLRVGDIVDYSYTISGENPVLGGRFADTLYLADRQPIRHLAYRLLWPSQRVLSVKNANIDIKAEIRPLGTDTEYFWERQNTEAVTLEDFTPGWFDPYPTVSLTDFRSWQDVVQWAVPLYQLPGPNAPELFSKIERWQAELGSQEQRAVAALRFVQDEIRYLGIELGRYSHQPTSPSKVYTRRFGDCKDKALLLSAILNLMGIDAAPALVNTTATRSLDTWVPSPFAFDHVIVQAKINGKTYWLDPTISYQRGGFDQYYDPPYERALVLREGARELEKIPLPASDSGSIVVKEIYHSQDGRGPISLLVDTTYKGAEADDMRDNLSSKSLGDVGKSYLNFYADANPSIRAEGLPEVADDQSHNTLVVKEKYSIDQFWKDNKHQFFSERIYTETGKPKVSQRSSPLRIQYPRSINHTIEINLAEPYDIPSDRGTLSDDALSFEYSYSTEGNLIRLEYSLKTFTDSIPSEKVQRHLLLIDKIQNLLGFELSGRTGPVVAYSSKPSGRTFDAIVGTVVVSLLITLPILVVRARLRGRRKSEFARRQKARAGTVPETAIHVSEEDELDALVRNFRCSCGGRPYQPESPPERERFNYDGQCLIGIRLHCGACAMDSDLYFNLRTAGEQLVTGNTD